MLTNIPLSPVLRPPPGSYTKPGRQPRPQHTTSAAPRVHRPLHFQPESAPAFDYIAKTRCLQGTTQTRDDAGVVHDNSARGEQGTHNNITLLTGDEALLSRTGKTLVLRAIAANSAYCTRTRRENIPSSSERVMTPQGLDKHGCSSDYFLADPKFCSHPRQDKPR